MSEIYKCNIIAINSNIRFLSKKKVRLINKTADEWE